MLWFHARRSNNNNFAGDRTTVSSPKVLASLKSQVIALVISAVLVSGLASAWFVHGSVPLAFPFWAMLAAITACMVVLAVWVMGRMNQSVAALRDRIQRLLDRDVPAESEWPQTRGEFGQVEEVIRQVAVERERTDRKQHKLIDHLQAILRNASVGILFTRDGRFEMMGEHFCEMMGYEAKDLLGQQVRMIYPSDEAYAELGARVRAAFSGEGYFDGELQFKRKDGSLYWAHMLGRGVVPNDPSGGTIWIIEDITEARAAREELSWSATHDSLTELVNRREFETRLTEALVHSGASNVCVMCLDLDRFKPINDTAGHAAGDDALRQIAGLLSHEVRLSDTVARMGGDEFAVLLPGCPLPRAQQLAENMRARVDAWRMEVSGHTFTLGASIGIVEASPQLCDLESLLRAADAACYEAKHRGRNQVVTFSPAGLST